MSDLKELHNDLQGVVTLMRENADAMRAQDERLQDVESLLKEKDDRVQEEINRIEEKIDAVVRQTASRRDAEGDPAGAEHAAVVRKYLLSGDTRMTDAEKTILFEGPAEYKTMSVNSDGDGGFWVTPDMSGRMAERIYDSSPVRQWAAQQTITTDSLEGIADNDEATVSWVDEEGARTATASPTIDKWRIPTHEQYAMPEATQKLLDDAGFNVEDWLADKVGSRMGRAESTAFVTGTGVGQPRGFMTYADGTTWGTIEQVATGDANFLTGDGLIDLVYTLQVGYRSNAAFFMNRTSEAAVRKLVDGQSQYLWAPGLANGQPSTLLGYPVATFEDMADVAATALPVAFGDLNRAYQIVERQGTRVLRDPFTNKPYIRFYTTRRVGGDVVNFDAIKIQDVNA